jgi:hypothetical protein
LGDQFLSIIRLALFRANICSLLLLAYLAEASLTSEGKMQLAGESCNGNSGMGMFKPNSRVSRDTKTSKDDTT